MKRVTGFLSVALVSSTALAWGGRGHHVICSVAVQLVQEKGLQELLKSRPHVMGHLCNVPDIYWKSLPKEVSKSGDAAHFMDPEITGIKIKDLPLDFTALENRFSGQENRFKTGAKIHSFADEFGSLWWRADQFFRRVSSRKEAFSSIVPPAGRKEEQDAQLPYNQEIYDMIVNMGLLGHFVGDASQPLHNTADYDGYGSGHGGLHSYYEEQVVTQGPADIEGRIYAVAKKIDQAPWLKGTVLERMKALSESSAAEIPMVLAKDPIKKKSESRKEKGMDLRTAAKREPATVGWKRYDSMIVAQMARSARLLARLWDQMYVAVGKPDLSAYRSYRYPLMPDFVSLDYLKGSTEREPKK
jgi:hypothetical protein